jgi:integrase
MPTERELPSAADFTRNFQTSLKRLALQPGDRVEIRDDDVSGLILRVAANGKASWFLRTRTQDGKQTRPKLGDYPGMGLSAARVEARKVLAQIQSGGDIVAEKRAKRAARATQLAEPTVADRFATWIEAKEKDPLKPLANRTAREYRRSFEHDVLPKLGKRPLRQVSREEWTALVAAKRKNAPSMASLLYRTISSFLSHAEAHGWIPAHPLPRKGLNRLAPPAKPRQRTLDNEEIADVMRASDLLSDKTRTFVRLLALTGVRETLVANIKVGDVDLEAGIWTAPAEEGSKNYEERRVPLCALALEALRRIWPTDDVSDDYKLLGFVAGGGFQGFSKLKVAVNQHIADLRAKVASETGTLAGPMPPWRWHDLRRSVRTGMSALGVPKDIAELAVGHISGRTAVVRTYDTYDFADEIHDALVKWQAAVARLIGDDKEIVSPQCSE